MHVLVPRRPDRNITMIRNRITLPLLGLFAFAALSTTACGKSKPEASAENKVEASADEKAEAKPAKVELAQLDIGKAAPEFQLTDLAGESHKLSDYRGKTVVLEWFNPECPFVVYAHGEGPLNDLAKTTVSGDDDVVWLAINSSAEGKQGAGKAVNEKATGDWNMDHPVLLDPEGKVGRQYGAKTTPHMYIIDPEGKLVYQGALDNAPFGKLKDPSLNIYVRQGLEAMKAKKPLDPAETKPYGCSVKYAS